VNKDLQVKVDHEVKLVNLEDKEPQDKEGSVESLGHLVQLDQLDLLGQQENVGLLDPLALLVKEDQLALLGQEESLVSVELLVHQVHLELEENAVHLE
jgi:hypothetical protein